MALRACMTISTNALKADLLGSLPSCGWPQQTLKCIHEDINQCEWRCERWHAESRVLALCSIWHGMHLGGAFSRIGSFALSSAASALWRLYFPLRPVHAAAHSMCMPMPGPSCMQHQAAVAACTAW